MIAYLGIRLHSASSEGLDPVRPPTSATMHSRVLNSGHWFRSFVRLLAAVRDHRLLRCIRPVPEHEPGETIQTRHAPAR